MIKRYYDKYGLDVRIVRIFNTFGPRMRLNDGRVITNFIQATLQNKPMIIHGAGTQTRSPAYVTDLADALIRIADSDTISTFEKLEDRIFNAGNTEEYTINQIGTMTNQLMQKHFGTTVPIQHIKHIDATDPKMRKPDISRLQLITGYQPKVPFEIGLEKMFIHCHHEKKKSL